MALRGLLGRKFRAALTAVAIVLGVAMISGSLVLTDTIDRAFNRIFVESYAGTDAVVSAASSDINFQGEAAESPPIPASVLDEVREVSTVDVATGGIFEDSAVKIIDRDGDPIVKNAPTFGFGIDASIQRFNPLDLKDGGRWPTGPNEVVIDAGTAKDESFSVGDRVAVATLQPVRDFEVVGIAQYGGVESLGGATFAVFDVATAQELLDRQGHLDAIQVAAKPGTSPDELARDLKAKLGKTVTVRTGTEQANEDSQEIAGFVAFIRYFLLTFGFIALFVGAFVIFNTLSITVAQRTRELATLRTIGASRRQVLGSVLVEALVIGALSSVIGLFLGVGLAKLLNWLFRLLEIELPTTGLVFSTRTVIVALAVGVVVTLVAGLAPALRATRVPPISAVREGATLPSGRFSRVTPYLAGVLVVLAVALLSYSLFAGDIDVVQRLLSIAGGVLALFFGVALLSPKLVRPLVQGLAPAARMVMLGLSAVYYPVLLAAWLLSDGIVGRRLSGGRRALGIAGGVLLPLAYGVALIAVLWQLDGLPSWLLLVPWLVAATSVLAAAVLALSIPILLFLRSRGRDEIWGRPTFAREPSIEQLSRENSRRNPGRTAATAAALMIGIALVTFVAVLGQGLRESNRDAITEQIHADLVITSEDGYTPFVAGASDAAARWPEAELVTDVRREIGRVAGSGQEVTGIDADRITQAYSFDWKEGSDAVLAGLGDDGAIIRDTFADDENLARGDSFELRTPGGKTHTFTVKGIYEPSPFYPLLGSVSISKDSFDSAFGRKRNRFTFVNVAGEPTKEAEAGLEAAVAKFPDARVQTRQEWIDKEDAEFQTFLSMLYILLALSVIVSIFGIINTLVLSVFERTRELGMLRAVGMTRRQTRGLIRFESVITALLGAALGLPLGIFLAALVTRALGQFEVQFTVPILQLELFVVVAIVVGIVAALLPARRAARLNVLEALQYE
ncbi:MAG: ABC transporter permease [Gaiellaceae bacterium]